MKDICKTFGQKVRTYCDAKGITQDELAERTQIDPEIIQAIFDGKHDASLKEVEAIAKVLEVLPFHLIDPI